jgi:hypothetical protein
MTQTSVCCNQPAVLTTLARTDDRFVVERVISSAVSERCRRQVLASKLHTYFSSSIGFTVEMQTGRVSFTAFGSQS